MATLSPPQHHFPTIMMVGNELFSMAKGYRSEEELQELYHGKGMSIADVADYFDVSYSTIYRWMDKFNIEKRTAKQEMDGDWRDKETLERLYVQEKLTIPEIGERLGCGKTTVHRWLKKHGIERRKSGIQDRVHYSTGQDGYERWSTHIGDSAVTYRVHRLVAIAEFGIDAVKDKHVHHINQIKWDNRPDNLVPLSPSDHMDVHHGDSSE